MSAYLLVNLHAQALNNIPDKGLHEQALQLLVNFLSIRCGTRGKARKISSIIYA